MASTVMLTVALLVLPTESFAVTTTLDTTLLVPALVGVPEITPVEALINNPLGNVDPLAAAHDQV